LVSSKPCLYKELSTKGIIITNNNYAFRLKRYITFENQVKSLELYIKRKIGVTKTYFIYFSSIEKVQTIFKHLFKMIPLKLVSFIK